MVSRINQHWSIVGLTFLILVFSGTIEAQRAHAQCQYDVTIIQGPDCPWPYPPPVTIGTGINDLGHVVGYYNHCGGAEGSEAFLWTPESGLTTLALPLDVLSAQASDINDAGQIVGTMGGIVTPFRAYLYEQGEILDLGVLPGAHWSGASALNPQTQIVGWSSNVIDGPHEAFRWEDGVMSTLELPLGPNSGAADINESKNQIVGWMGTSTSIDSHAFLWEDGEVTDLGPIPGGFTSTANAINNLAHIVGSGKLPYDGPGQLKHAFLWIDGEMIDLGTLPGFDRCAALDINDAGQIVGTCNQSSDPNNFAPFLRQGGVMTDLNGLIAAELDLGLRWGKAINNANQILCWGRASSGDDVGVLLTPVIASPGDLDCDGQVGPADLATLLGSWGGCNGCAADLNGDGVVNPTDLAMLLGNWG